MGNCTDSDNAAAPSTPAGQNNSQPNNQTPAPVNTTTTTNKPTTTATKVQPTKTDTTKPAGNSKWDLELAKHNEYRAKHKASPLVLSEWLNKGAQAWADNLAKKKLFEHSECSIEGKDVGENIYMTTGTVSGGDATKAWYDEVKDYKYGSGEGTFGKTGHFSQVVWKASKEVGFGYAGGIVVANYYPAGNLMGSWEKNVEKP